MSRTYAKPCVVCGKELYNVVDDSENQADNGLHFRSPGHYGSTQFDPMDGSFLEVNICDGCIVEARDEGRVLYGRDRKPVMTHDNTLVGWCKTDRPLIDWTGDETSSFDPGAAEDVLYVYWEDVGAVDFRGEPLYPEIDWTPGVRERAGTARKRAAAHQRKLEGQG